MTTYVNGKVCSTINKGVFQTPDGRFAVSTDSIFLFASINESFMPGIRIKYFEFRPQTMSMDVRILALDLAVTFLKRPLLCARVKRL